MQLYLYTTSDEHEKINKNVSRETLVNFSVKEETNILQPVIFISGSLDNITSFNYAHVPDWKRYYYITNCEIVRTNMYRLTLKVDVLMSHKTGILNNKAILKRSEMIYDSYLQNSNIKMEAYKQIQTKSFNYTFVPETSLLLTTLGGAS